MATKHPWVELWATTVEWHIVVFYKVHEYSALRS